MADIVYPGQTGEVLNEDALPSNVDLVIYKGDYVEVFFVCKDALGAPVNITGFTPKAVLKFDYNDRDPKPFTCTVVAETPGMVRVFMGSATTSQLLPGSYIYDLQVTDLASQTKTYFAGDVTVYNEVTT